METFWIILGLNICSSAIGVLKNIFVVRGYKGLASFLVLIDATVYAFVLKSFATSGYEAIIAYIAGHVIGYWVAALIERLLAVGIYNIVLYVGEKELMLYLQDTFKRHDFSTTAQIGLIDEDKERYSLELQLSRRDMKDFYKILKEVGIVHPTMMIQEVKSVAGKIEERL